MWVSKLSKSNSKTIMHSNKFCNLVMGLNLCFVEQWAISEWMCSRRKRLIRAIVSIAHHFQDYFQGYFRNPSQLLSSLSPISWMQTSSRFLSLFLSFSLSFSLSQAAALATQRSVGIVLLDGSHAIAVAEPRSSAEFELTAFTRTSWYNRAAQLTIIAYTR